MTNSTNSWELHALIGAKHREMMRNDDFYEPVWYMTMDHWDEIKSEQLLSRYGTSIPSGWDRPMLLGIPVYITDTEHVYLGRPPDD